MVFESADVVSRPIPPGWVLNRKGLGFPSKSSVTEAIKAPASIPGESFRSRKSPFSRIDESGIEVEVADATAGRVLDDGERGSDAFMNLRILLRSVLPEYIVLDGSRTIEIAARIEAHVSHDRVVVDGAIAGTETSSFATCAIFYELQGSKCSNRNAP